METNENHSNLVNGEDVSFTSQEDHIVPVSSGALDNSGRTPYPIPGRIHPRPLEEGGEIRTPAHYPPAPISVSPARTPDYIIVTPSPSPVYAGTPIGSPWSSATVPVASSAGLYYQAPTSTVPQMAGPVVSEYQPAYGFPGATNTTWPTPGDPGLSLYQPQPVVHMSHEMPAHSTLAPNMAAAAFMASAGASNMPALPQPMMPPVPRGVEWRPESSFAWPAYYQNPRPHMHPSVPQYALLQPGQQGHSYFEPRGQPRYSWRPNWGRVDGPRAFHHDQLGNGIRRRNSHQIRSYFKSHLHGVPVQNALPSGAQGGNASNSVAGPSNVYVANGKKASCAFCHRKGEEHYEHRLKNKKGEVLCPVLRSYTCKLCGKTGKEAHTIKYCPMNPFTHGDPKAAGLKPGMAPPELNPLLMN
ncbi:putative nanos [Halocaridina rubra]|uniref:Nanos n=1 Tax=Halocaridina rubra TaxID=373956 RepID=A0AAN9A1V8_HALRR